MSNPFESEEHEYLVLRNEEGQYSLWPKFAEVPSGWTSVYGPQARDACMSFVSTTWTDMRPRSLTEPTQ